MVWYNPISWARSKKTVEATTTSPTVYSITPNPSGKATYTVIQPSTTTKDIVTQTKSGVKLTSTNNRSRTTSNYQGPVPEQTSESSEDTFRETGVTTFRPQARTTAVQVKEFSRSEQAKQNVQTIEQNRITGKKLNLPLGSPFINRLQEETYKQETSLQQSRMPPKIRNIKELESNRELTPKQTSEAISRSAFATYTQTYERESAEDIGKYKGKIESEFKQRDIEREQRIMAGGNYKDIVEEQQKDLLESNKRVSEFAKNYPKQWEESRGKYIRSQAQKVSFDANIVYSDKEAKRNLLKPFLGGTAFGAGAGAVGIGLSKVSTKAGAVFGVAGAVGGGLITTYSYVKSGLTGYSTYKEAKKLGFTTSQSLTRGIGTFGTSLTPFASASVGALAGGLAVAGGYNVYKTGNIRGFTKIDQKNVEVIVNRQNAVKFDLTKGKVSEAELLRTGLVDGKKVGLENAKKFVVTREFDVGLNTKGLTPSEVKTAGKINLRGKVMQKFGMIDNKFTGIEGTEIKTGGIGGEITQTFTEFKGIVKEGKLTGVKTVLTQTGKTTTLGFEAFKGTGKVGYSNNKLLRGEVSKGYSIKFAEAKWIDGEFKGVSFDRTLTTGKSFFTSRLDNIEIGGKVTGGLVETEMSSRGVQIFKSGKVLDMSFVRNYQDVKGRGGGGQGFGEIFFKASGPKLPKTPISYFRSSSGSSYGSQSQVQVQQSSFILPSTSFSKMSIGTTMTKPFVSSVYAGTGQYERTGEMEGRTIAGNRINILNFKSSNLPKGINIYKGGAMKSLVKTTGSSRIFSPTTSVTPIVNFTPISRQNITSVISPRILKISKFSSGSSGLFASPIVTTNFGGGITPPPVFALPFRGDWGLRTGELFSFRKYKYTPSFKAIAFGIKGRTPKTKRFTGLEIRPIVKGGWFSKAKKR